MSSRRSLRMLRGVPALASLTTAIACGPVSNGPEPVLYMPPVEEQSVSTGFDEPIRLTMAVEVFGLRRPPIRETVDAQIAAMTQYARRHGRGLGESGAGKMGGLAPGDARAQASRLARAASQLLSYLPLDASPEGLARTSVTALAKSLGDDAEILQGNLFATPGAAEISAGMFGGIAVLRLRHLDTEMNDRVQDAFNQWSAAAERPRALLLDLSECASGGPRTATTLVNALAPGKPVLGILFRDDESDKTRQQTWVGDAGWGSTAFAKLPVFVLVSGHTASTAEAVVHALRAHRSAHVIGHRTVGSGRILAWNSLPWNAWFGFTIADLFGVDRVPLRDKPVIPDTCPGSTGLVALSERTPEAYGKICVDGSTPALEDVLDHVGVLLAAEEPEPQSTVKNPRRLPPTLSAFSPESLKL